MGDGEWLIPEPIRSKGTADEILKCTVWDHVTPVANGGSNDPRNLQPLSVAVHAVKTAKDVTGIAKGKRLARSAEETRRIILARVGQLADGAAESMRRRVRNPLPCGKASGWKKPLGKLNAVRRTKP